MRGLDENHPCPSSCPTFRRRLSGASYSPEPCLDRSNPTSRRLGSGARAAMVSPAMLGVPLSAFLPVPRAATSILPLFARSVVLGRYPLADGPVAAPVRLVSVQPTRGLLSGSLNTHVIDQSHVIEY
jgi:hypothetical protein